MAYRLPSKGSFSFSNDFSKSSTITSISNASSAVIVFDTAPGYSVGDTIVLETPEWEHATNKCYKITATTDTKTFVLGGFDTINTDKFPTGSARGGTAKKILSWKPFPQVLSIDNSGGRTVYAEVRPVFTKAFKLADGSDPMEVNLTLGYDPTNPVFGDLKSISEDGSMVAVKLTITGPANGYMYGSLFFRSFPSIRSGEVLSVEVSFTDLGDFRVY